MTIPSNDDPEIALGGDPAPSAPPATASFTGRQPTASLPTAVATPLPTAPPTHATLTTSSGGNIERTTNPDGSLSVKITTTTPQSNGYREVKIEYFHIPANMASTVTMSLDAGGSPSNLYMTKMEQQVLPPGTGAVMSRPPAYPIPGYTPTTTTAPHQQETAVHGSSANDSRKFLGLCCGTVCLVLVILGIVGGAAEESYTQSSGGYDDSWPTPSWTPYPVSTPSWHYPTPTPPSWHYPPGRSGSPTYWWEKDNPFSTPSPTISSEPTTTPSPTYPPFVYTIPPAFAPFFNVPTISPSSVPDGTTSKADDDASGGSADPSMNSHKKGHDESITEEKE